METLESIMLIPFGQQLSSEIYRTEILTSFSDFPVIPEVDANNLFIFKILNFLFIGPRMNSFAIINFCYEESDVCNGYKNNIFTKWIDEIELFSPLCRL